MKLDNLHINLEQPEYEILRWDALADCDCGWNSPKRFDKTQRLGESTKKAIADGWLECPSVDSYTKQQHTSGENLVCMVGMLDDLAWDLGLKMVDDSHITPFAKVFYKNDSCKFGLLTLGNPDNLGFRWRELWTGGTTYKKVAQRWANKFNANIMNNMEENYE